MKFLIVLILLLPFSALAQNAKTDSLKRVIETTADDKARCRALCHLCEELRNKGAYAQAIENGLAGYDLGNRLGYGWAQSNCSNCIAVVYWFSNDMPNALKYWELALAAFERSGQQNSITNTLNCIGNVYWKQSNYPKAQEYFARSFEMAEKLRRPGEATSALGNLALTYKEQGNYAKALEYNLKCLERIDETQLPSNFANILNNVGNIYIDQKNYAKALEFHKRSLAIMERIKDTTHVAKSMNNIGNTYIESGDLEQALEWHSKALRLREKTGDPVALASSYSNLARIYSRIEKNELAYEYAEKGMRAAKETGSKAKIATSNTRLAEVCFKLGRYAKGREHAKQGLELAQEIGQLIGLKESSQILYKLDSALGHWESAFHSLHLYKTCSDSLKNDEQSQSLGRLEAQFESQKELTQRDLAITRLEAQRLRDDLNLKVQRGKYLQDSLANADQQAVLETQSLRLAQQVKEQALKRSQDSLLNASRFERLERERVQAEAIAQRQRWFLGSAAGGLLLLVVIAYTLFRGRLKEKKANAALKTLNEEIQQQKAEIEAMNAELQATLTEVNEQKMEIEAQHAKIEDSIRYASRIQHAILPSEMQLKESLSAHFIHYQPRDIVSGDFYWLTRHADRTFFAVVDCTGHGVPGAFMSVLGSNLLHQIVDENQIVEPDVILAELDRRISQTLHQHFGGDSKDGMDLALLVIHEAAPGGSRLVEFAGAGRPLWIWSKGQIIECQSASFSCGGSQHEGKTYPAKRIEVQSGDRLFVFSDGAVDQFGGPAGRKLGSKQLQTFLAETAAMPVTKQGEAFAAYFSDWMKERKQIDDVLMAGIAV